MTKSITPEQALENVKQAIRDYGVNSSEVDVHHAVYRRVVEPALALDQILSQMETRPTE